MPEARLSIHVQPGARRSEVVGLVGGVVRLRIAAPAHEGRANDALVAFLSDRLGVPKSRVRVVRGHSSRDKVVAVEGMDADEAVRRLPAG